MSEGRPGPTLFEVAISLGNEQMQTAEHVAIALRKLVVQLEDEQLPGGVIRDANGNTVGSWSLL